MGGCGVPAKPGAKPEFASNSPVCDGKKRIPCFAKALAIVMRKHRIHACNLSSWPDTSGRLSS